MISSEIYETRTAQPILLKTYMVEEPIKGRPSSKFRAPASTTAPGIHPEEKKGHLPKTEISASEKFSGRCSRTLAPILMKLGRNLPQISL